MYEGDLWQIADELGVYPGVVDDYRKLVIPSTRLQQSTAYGEW